MNATEAKIVKRIFKMVLELQSCRKVAEALNAEGILMKKYTTKTGKDFGGGPWKTKSIHDLLTDQKYIGKIVHKGVAYDGEHKAIISTALFDQVQGSLLSNKTYTHKHQVQRFALLRRMLRCGECGNLVQPVWTKNHGREYRYYTCSTRVKTGYKKCTLPSLPAGEIESMVVDQLREILRNPELIARTFRDVATRGATGPAPEDVSRLEERRGRRKRAEQAIRSLLTLDDPESEFIQTELKRNHGELKLINDAIKQIESKPEPASDVDLSEVMVALQRIDPIWEVLVPDEQRRVLELLVEEITVANGQVDVQFRFNGIEQMVNELTPMRERNGKCNGSK